MRGDASLLLLPCQPANNQPSQMARGCWGPGPGVHTPHPTLCCPQGWEGHGVSPDTSKQGRALCRAIEGTTLPVSKQRVTSWTLPVPTFTGKGSRGPSGGPLPGSRLLDLYSWELGKRNHGAPGPGTKVLSVLTHPQRSSSSLVLLVPASDQRGRGVCA